MKKCINLILRHKIGFGLFLLPLLLSLSVLFGTQPASAFRQEIFLDQNSSQPAPKYAERINNTNYYNQSATAYNFFQSYTFGKGTTTQYELLGVGLGRNSLNLTADGSDHWRLTTIMTVGVGGQGGDLCGVSSNTYAYVTINGKTTTITSKDFTCTGSSSTGSAALNIYATLEFISSEPITGTLNNLYVQLGRINSGDSGSGSFIWKPANNTSYFMIGRTATLSPIPVRFILEGSVGETPPPNYTESLDKIGDKLDNIGNIIGDLNDGEQNRYDNEKEEERSRESAGGETNQQAYSLFNFGIILFPFLSAFTYSDDCVSIPIIASWLHLSESTLCPVFPNNIRAAVTPVVTIFATLLIFTFAWNWFRGIEVSHG